MRPVVVMNRDEHLDEGESPVVSPRTHHRTGRPHRTLTRSEAATTTVRVMFVAGSLTV